MTIEFDPRTPENIANPYPAFAELREKAPVFWSDKLGAWLITRYDDVKSAFRDRRLSSDRIRPFIDHMKGDLRKTVEPLGEQLSHWAVFNDPPVHTRLRGLMNKAFTSSAVERLRDNIAGIVDELLERMLARPDADFVRDFAYPLPATVIADMLGVPRKDVDLLKKWSDDLATFVLTSRANPEKYKLAAVGMVEMAEYFTDFVARRKGVAKDDVTTGLLEAQLQGDALTVDELVACCVLLLFAGHETTTQLLANGMWGLLTHPGELAKLKANIGTVAYVQNAVEEMLRWDGPSLSIVRVAAEDFAWHGETIESGDRVFLMQAAANRDPAIFAEPDRFDVTRAEAKQNIAFGFGIHFCIGAPLARLEGEIAFSRLIGRLRDAKPRIARPQWSDSLLTRGMKALPIELRV
ncbi:MAG: cytochrome P450 [Alphaproteobacteria bacterium]